MDFTPPHKFIVHYFEKNVEKERTKWGTDFVEGYGDSKEDGQGSVSGRGELMLMEIPYPAGGLGFFMAVR